MKLLAARVDGSAVVAVRHWRRLLRLLLSLKQRVNSIKNFFREYLVPCISNPFCFRNLLFI